MLKGVALLLAGSSSTLALANSPSRSVFMPENKLHLEDRLDKDANMTEAQFNEIVDYVISYYSDLAKGHGATLTPIKNWTDGTVNAYAEQVGSTWKVSMFGGLARRPETTADGFALVVCHELGHHFGGFPFYGPSDWAATEGQSDYFATQVCGKRIWRNQPEVNARFRATAPAIVKQRCDQVYAATADQDLCYRLNAASQSLANLLAALGSQGTPKFDTPDTRVVSRTNTAHPDAQCRLDTYFAGSLCNSARWDDAMIPGRNHADGQESLGAESVASAKSCTEAQMFSLGVRPRCWFAPKLALALSTAAATTEEVEGNGNGAWEPGETYALNVPLTNNLLTAVEGATLAISSDNAQVTADRASVAYPSIAAGETAVAESPINVAVAEGLACGSKFRLTSKVTVGTFNTSNTAEYMLGKLNALANVTATPGTAIPDNTPAGIDSVVRVAAAGNANRAVVTLDVSHTYPGDLRITLVSPSGKSYVVFNRVNNSTGGIKASFPVDLTAEAATGNWKLNVADLAGVDTGRLNGWTLALQGVSCEGTPAITLAR